MTSHEVIIKTIGAVTTKAGLTLDTGVYPKGIKITDRQMKAFETRQVQRHTFQRD